MAVNDFQSPVNRVVLKERDNKGLVGSHFDPLTMSLRARLNLGIDLQPVSLGMTQNDPNSLNRLVKNFSQTFNSLLESRVLHGELDSASVVQEPSKSE